MKCHRQRCPVTGSGAEGTVAERMAELAQRLLGNHGKRSVSRSAECSTRSQGGSVDCCRARTIVLEEAFVLFYNL